LTDTSLPWDIIAAPATLSLVAVTALVISDYRGITLGRFICKPIAAAAFIWLALALGATNTIFGLWMLAALTLCMVGDICLMFEHDKAFLAGLGAFLCGHLLFAVAFVQLPLNPTGLLLSLVPGLLLMVLVGRWLQPHVPREMKIPVALYVIVITGMLLCAGLTLGAAPATLIIAGAWGFAASDLAVARRQFVDPSPANALWGTPLYFGSQMVLATTIALT
jgi:uncharacterized membrane protein YhhN